MLLSFEVMHIASRNAIGQARLIPGGDKGLRVEGDPISPPGRNAKLSWRHLYEKHGAAVAEQVGRPAAPCEPIYRPPANDLPRRMRMWLLHLPQVFDGGV